MMRLTYLENRTNLADSGERVTDIRVVDPITALDIVFEATNGGTSNIANTLPQTIDSIDLIDGSEVLYSLDGEEAFGVSTYQRGHIVNQVVTEEASAVQRLSIPIFFGRTYGDEQYAFDATRFSNPQLRINWNLANVRSVGATGFLSGSLYLSVIAHVMEGAPNPAGLLSWKEHYSFVTSSSGVTYVDLPTDHKLRGFYVKCHENGVGASANLSFYKLNCNQGQYVPFDLSRQDYLNRLTVSFPPLTYRHIFLAKDSDTVYFILKYLEAVGYVAGTADTVVSGVNSGVGEQTLEVYTGGTAASTELAVAAHVTGWLPYGVSYFPLGTPYNPDSWLDVGQFRSVRLELTNANAGANAAVVVEQEYVY